MEKTGLNMEEVIEELIVPLLLSAGYADKTIGDRIRSDVVGSPLLTAEEIGEITRPAPTGDAGTAQVDGHAVTVPYVASESAMP